MTKKHLLTVTVLLMLLRLVTIAVLPLTDPTEGRYSVIAQQMVESNDWITPSVWMNGQLIPFLGKPPLQFWLSAVSVKLFGLNEFALRLPAFLSGLLLLCFVYLTLKKTNTKETAFAGTAITASTAIFLGVCGAVATDMTFSAMTGIAILCYILFSIETAKPKQKIYSLAVFTFLGLAFMTKGPVSLIIFGGPVFIWTVLTKKWRTLRNHAWLTGTLLFLILTVPWFIACERANPGFLKYFFINENFLRFITPNYGDRYGHGHQYMRGAAVIMMLIGCLPWTPIAIYTLARKKLPFIREKLQTPAFGIALTGILFITLFWCLARQLLATYILPVVPLIAVLLAPVIDKRVLKYTLHGSLALAAVATAGACLFMTGPDSLKQTLRTVNAREEKSPQPAKLVFFRETPYSAYIYSADSLVSLPRENIDQTLQRSENADYDHLLVFRKKRFNRLKPYQKNNLVIVYKNDSWFFVRIKKT